MTIAHRFSVIAMMDEKKRGIGKNGGLPCRLPTDMAYFKRVTMDAPDGKRNAVLMGRKTYFSIPAKFRPLSGRLNIVLTRDITTVVEPGVVLARSLDEALREAASRLDVHRVYVAGGGEIYAEAMRHPGLTSVLLTTVVGQDFGCDTFFPAIDTSVFHPVPVMTAKDGVYDLVFEKWRR